MKYLNFFIVFALLIILGACNQQKKGGNASQPLAISPKEGIKYSTVEGILEQAGSLSGKTVNVSGIIEHVCKHGGKRFKILSSDGSQELKIELGENFKAVDACIVGKNARVTGTLIPVQMDAKKVKEWEKKVRKNHEGEENTEHFKHEVSEIQDIYNRIELGEIPFYTSYSVQANNYELE